MSKINLNVNKIIIGGYLGRDAETKPTINGNVTKFSVGTSHYNGKKDGVPEYLANFHNVVSFNLHERIVPKLKKGNPVIVEGEQVNSYYINKEGDRINTSEIYANRIHVIASAASDTGEETEQQAKDVNVEDNEDLPF